MMQFSKGIAAFQVNYLNSLYKAVMSITRDFETLRCTASDINVQNVVLDVFFIHESISDLALM